MFGIFNGIGKTIRHIANMYVVALEILFENHDVPLGHRRVSEMIDQQVKAHTRRQSKHGSQAQGHRIGTFQKVMLGLALGLAVKRDWL